MSDTLDNAALTALCGYLMKELRTVSHRVETMLLLLEHREIFSDDEFSQLLSQVRADYDSDLLKVLSKAVDDAQTVAVRRLLESFEGPKQ